MQAAPQENPSSSNVIIFYAPMHKSAPKIPPPDSPPPSTSSFWQRHGNTAQWASACIASLAALVSAISLLLTLHWHNAAAASTTADDHVQVLIDKRLDPINQRLDHLTEQVNDVVGQLKRIDEENRLANIRTALQVATDTKKLVPPAEMVRYRNTISALPSSAKDYWTTVAAIINYQSLLNRMLNLAPDPSAVSRPCLELTAGIGRYNTFHDT